ncbi:hypothetical protein CkaCkLH20_09171 [Colletotrichum karsti]|uniref:Uncharacterized protein n=1 Tax=Colletotrichum karsti TaxID=1095194 RepID=A0A9P6LHA4_9PEZI|nr:uncharacterized protein CkaCkLH20_09171 [Colletotrichum karsti]KAF9873358.1 hypothetical protein CkaCkLH20_09171 [Colletotrichum karsti]
MVRRTAPSTSNIFQESSQSIVRGEELKGAHAYIMAESQSSSEIEFVADMDSAASTSKANEDAKIEEAPVTTPTLGLPYKPTPAKTLGQKQNYELALVAMNSPGTFKQKHSNQFPPTEPSSLQFTSENLPNQATSEFAAVADPNIPDIYVKNTDTGSVQESSGGSVFPASALRSPRHLRVNDLVRDQGAPRQRITIDGGKHFWDRVDRLLGLNRVRSSGEDVGDWRRSAKLTVYRAILIFGFLMMLSLITSVVLFVVLGEMGKELDPAWFVWIGVSGAGLIGSILAFIMANRQRNRARFEEEIARQSRAIAQRRTLLGGSDVDIEMNVVSSPSNNEQQVQRSAAAAAASVAAAVGTSQGRETQG